MSYLRAPRADELLRQALPRKLSCTPSKLQEVRPPIQASKGIIEARICSRCRDHDGNTQELLTSWLPNTEFRIQAQAGSEGLPCLGSGFRGVMDSVGPKE